VPVVVEAADVNAIAADAIVVPIDANLAADRRLAKAALSACDARVAESLSRLASVAVMGLAPGTILRLARSRPSARSPTAPRRLVRHAGRRCV